MRSRAHSAGVALPSPRPRVHRNRVGDPFRHRAHNGPPRSEPPGGGGPHSRSYGRPGSRHGPPGGFLHFRGRSRSGRRCCASNHRPARAQVESLREAGVRSAALELAEDGTDGGEPPEPPVRNCQSGGGTTCEARDSARDDRPSREPVVHLQRGSAHRDGSQAREQSHRRRADLHNDRRGVWPAQERWRGDSNPGRA
jgi:hypothetical protein